MLKHRPLSACKRHPQTPLIWPCSSLLWNFPRYSPLTLQLYSSSLFRCFHRNTKTWDENSQRWRNTADCCRKQNNSPFDQVDWRWRALPVGSPIRRVRGRWRLQVILSSPYSEKISEIICQIYVRLNDAQQYILCHFSQVHSHAKSLSLAVWSNHRLLPNTFHLGWMSSTERLCFSHFSRISPIY